MGSNIYTKSGDKGRTSLIGGTRVAKNDIRLEAYGTIDELNAHIGLLIALLSSDDEKPMLTKIQHRLFAVGGYLATDQRKGEVMVACKVTDRDLEDVEKRIDMIDAKLPPMTHFVLPGGSVAAAQSHVCRTVCRRAERLIVALAAESTVASELIIYINRLSDYLFVLGRKICLDEFGEEICWNKDFE